MSNCASKFPKPLIYAKQRRRMPTNNFNCQTVELLLVPNVKIEFEAKGLSRHLSCFEVPWPSFKLPLRDCYVNQEERHPYSGLFKIAGFLSEDLDHRPGVLKGTWRNEESRRKTNAKIYLSLHHTICIQIVSFVTTAKLFHLKIQNVFRYALRKTKTHI